MNGADDLPGELARLRNAVACELHAQLALRGEHIDLAEVPEDAYAVAVQLSRQFHIAEQWPVADDDDPLSLDSATFHASDLPTDRYPIFDHGWPAR